MYDVLAVADAILKIAKKDGISLTPMQLVKLTYIADGWSMALRNTPLFENSVEAWQYGPVIPDLYFVTKSYGSFPIPLTDVGDELDIKLESKDIDFITSVFAKYKDLDGMALSYLTHKAGTPWSNVYHPEIRNIIIPKEDIKQHYLDIKNGKY